MQLKGIVRGIILLVLQYFLIFVGIAVFEAGHVSIGNLLLCCSFLVGAGFIFIVFIYPIALKMAIQKDIETIETAAENLRLKGKDNNTSE